jgi:hypothetical protein
MSQPFRCEFFFICMLILRCYYVFITSFIDGKTGKRREQTVKHSVADFIDENGVVCQVNQSVVYFKTIIFFLRKARQTSVIFLI